MTIFVGMMVGLCVATVVLIILVVVDERWRRREIRQEPDRPYYPLHAKWTQDKRTVKIGPEQIKRAVEE